MTEKQTPLTGSNSDCKIISWNTYRKTLKELYTVRDSCKGWIKETVHPTMLHNGFKQLRGNDIDMDERKPKQILLNDFKYIINDSELVVYFVSIPTGNYAGFYKYLDIYYKLKATK